MHSVFHMLSLRKYNGDGPYQPSANPVVQDSTLFFDLDHISDTGRPPNWQYRVHWTGGEYSWHDAMLLHACEHYIHEFRCNRVRDLPLEVFPLPAARLADLLEGKQT